MDRVPRWHGRRGAGGGAPLGGRVHRDRQLLIEAGHRVLEPRDARCVAHDPTSLARTTGQWGRRRPPHCTRLVIPDKDGFAGWIGDRVVGEGRQPVLAAVLAPTERSAGGGDDCSKRGVRQNVRPWQGRLTATLQHEDVLAAVGRALQLDPTTSRGRAG